MITRTAPTWHTEDWQKQLSNCISSVQELLEQLELSLSELPAQLQAHQDFPIRVPRAYASKIQPGDANDPLLLQVLPQAQELTKNPGYSNDPLNEQQFNPLPGLIHKYQSRVLLTTSTACAINCRYCFRRHFPYQENRISQQQMRDITDYLNGHSEINEVIFSGGDPLASSNSRLAQWIGQLSDVKHLKRIRVHTRLPVVIPERIDTQLLELIESSSMQWVFVVHSNHPNELDNSFAEAMSLLRQRNVQLLNQSVLLKGINDDAKTLAELSESLFDCGVTPYYLHLLDPVAGAAHFEVPLKRAKLIHLELLRRLSGYLVPKLVKEVPEAPSKTPII
ncbi:MAG: EF-P beta-lysylation protein EpmB [Pseudomonadales bacterium]|nr:EF-P beta-lysylation protein EpmB [Pseudomonadales bacterium]